MSVDFLFIHVNEWAGVAAPDTIPISQGYGLAALRQAGHTGLILGDYQDRALAPAQVAAAMAERRPRVVGFSVYEENINRVRVWATFAKRLDPAVLVLLGGPQTTFMPAAALAQMPEVDLLCRGEGETVLLGLARALAEGTDLARAPGLCLRGADGSPVETGPAWGPESLDELPSPYLADCFDLAGKRRVILLSSRGCTSPCTFCYTTRASGHQVRFHSLDRVIAEMRHLVGQGITDFWFADPNFAHSRPRLEALLARISRELPPVSFWCQTRYNLVDPELLARLKAAGCHTLAFGLESADVEVLRRIRKGLDPGRMAQAIRDTQAAGIEVELFSLFGLPGESRAQAEATLDFVQANRVAVEGNSICQQLHIFFGTPIAEEPETHGVRPLPLTKPAYQSICRDFTTEAMDVRAMRQMGLFWRTCRTDFADKVASRRDLFEVAGFVTSHRQDLADRPEGELLLARIYLALEEYEAAATCLQGLVQRFPEHPAVRAFLARPLTAFVLGRRAVAAEGCRVIYDCRGFLDGEPVPETVSFFQEALV
ncbi:MAG: radical SAM protein, partial [Thermodesulfobacteriota bacterium]